jgi:ribosomal-protein-alanine N-acetyltransferase
MSVQPGARVPVIREMQSSDLDEITTIERRTYEFPWSRGIFHDCLIASYSCVVIDDGERIIGYAIVSSAAAEGHILNLCVDVELHRRGYGQQLLEYVLDSARQSRIRRLFLEVRPSNEAAIILYTQAGFNSLGVRKGYYKAVGGNEDALVLMREFSPEEFPPEEFS